jgi:hypothetical protein
MEFDSFEVMCKLDQRYLFAPENEKVQEARNSGRGRYPSFLIF